MGTVCDILCKNVRDGTRLVSWVFELTRKVPNIRKQDININEWYYPTFGSLFDYNRSSQTIGMKNSNIHPMLNQIFQTKYDIDLTNINENDFEIILTKINNEVISISNEYESVLTMRKFDNIIEQIYKQTKSIEQSVNKSTVTLQFIDNSAKDIVKY